MAAAFAQVHAGSIKNMHNIFQSWYFCQKTGKLYAEAAQCTQMDHAIFDHCSPFPAVPMPFAIVLPQVDAPMVLPNSAGIDIALQVNDGNGLAHQVNVDGKTNAVVNADVGDGLA